MGPAWARRQPFIEAGYRTTWSPPSRPGATLALSPGFGADLFALVPTTRFTYSFEALPVIVITPTFWVRHGLSHGNPVVELECCRWVQLKPFVSVIAPLREVASFATELTVVLVGPLARINRDRTSEL